MTLPTKLCNTCQTMKPVAEMVKMKKNGKTYIRGRCKACDSKRASAYHQQDDGRWNESIKQQRKAHRAAGTQPEKFIFWDSRGSDRKRGVENDLTQEFIREALKNGCSYCGETEIRMTLDRVDNDLGHTQANVVAACIRCNYTRKNMPHAAWLVVAESMRAAREAGLFNGWTGRARAPAPHRKR